MTEPKKHDNPARNSYETDDPEVLGFRCVGCHVAMGFMKTSPKRPTVYCSKDCLYRNAKPSTKESFHRYVAMVFAENTPVVSQESIAQWFGILRGTVGQITDRRHFFRGRYAKNKD